MPAGTLARFPTHMVTATIFTGACFRLRIFIKKLNR